MEVENCFRRRAFPTG